MLSKIILDDDSQFQNIKNNMIQKSNTQTFGYLQEQQIQNLQKSLPFLNHQNTLQSNQNSSMESNTNPNLGIKNTNIAISMISSLSPTSQKNELKQMKNEIENGNKIAICHSSHNSPKFKDEQNIIKQQFSVGKYSPQKQIFFQDLEEVQKIDKLYQEQKSIKQQEASVHKSPIHYVNQPPPGLTLPQHLRQENSQFNFQQTPQKQVSFNDIFENQQSQLKSNKLSTQPIQEEHELSKRFSQFFQENSEKQQAQENSQNQNSNSNQNFFQKREEFTKNLKLSANQNKEEHISQIQQQNQLFISSNKYSSQQKQVQHGKKPPIILEESQQRFTGKLKFFDEKKNFGFIIDDIDGSNIFVHFDDLQKSGVSKEFMLTAKQGNQIRFSFQKLKYMGKYKESKKAIDLQLLSNEQS